MKRRLLLCLVLSMFLLVTFAGGAFAAKKSRVPLRGLRVDGAENPGKYVGPSPVLYELSMQPDCEDVNPTFPVVIVDLQQNGMTYYDYQKNGSMGRMIAVSTAGNRSMIYHETRGDYTTYPRYVTYNCLDPTLTTWCGPIYADGGPLINAGYAQMLLLHDGRELAVYHTADRDAVIRLGASGNPCSCFLNTYFDVPDKHNAAVGGDPAGVWPKGCVVYDAGEDKDYIHLVTTENNAAGGQSIAYERCYLDGTNLVCCSPNDSCYTTPPNAYVNPDARPIEVFDTVMTIATIIVSSPVSKKVAIVYCENRDDFGTQVNNDVVYIESDSNGTDWLDGFNWPATRYNVTQYAPSNSERAYTDVAACYDYNDHLHIVWNSCYYDSVTGSTNNDANLMHWTDTSPLGFTNASTVAPGYWDDGTVDPGVWNRNVCKMSISAKDPVYHPDSVFLFVTWSQFNQNDLSADGLTNGDIYASVSHDSGRTWAPGYNLTGTETDNCAPGECLSEHWSSLAENMYGGDLHIQYVCDRDAGGIVQDEGSWTDNPVMYMQVQQLPDTSACGASYSLIDPPNFYDPPIKVSPGGLRVLTLQVRGIYNIAGDYEVTCAHPDVDITAGGSGELKPGEKKEVSVTIFCPEEDKFIAAVIEIHVCLGTDDEKTYEIRLHAVCNDDDYYECVRDVRTQIWKANSICSLWVCANTEQRTWDKRVFDTNGDIIQTIFSSGVIVATTEGTDTVVGRDDYGDTRAYARDTIEVYYGNMAPYFTTPAEPCSLQQVRATKTFICANQLAPPNHLKWWWVSINKHIMMFHGPSCPDFKKEQIIKYVWIEYGGLPVWWPVQDPYDHHNNMYVGLFSDVDAPFDTGCNGCNAAGYDDTRYIMWQRGYDAGSGMGYENYYVGLALTDRDGNAVTPLGAHNVKNNVYLYPNDGWGWKDGELCSLAATPGVTIQNGPPTPDSVVDRTWVITADMVNAGTNYNDIDAEFILIEAFIPTGLADLQQHIDDTRAEIIPELDSLGMFDRTVHLCGDCNGDDAVNIADAVCIVSYLFSGGPASQGPIWASDNNSDGTVNIADAVVIVTYLFSSGPPPKCSGFGRHVE